MGGPVIRAAFFMLVTRFDVRRWAGKTGWEDAAETDAASSRVVERSGMRLETQSLCQPAEIGP